ncbi:MAG: hypothetical protein QOI86_5006 [Actinomycetota bacterium]|nr:hypothetical protein [Actinomycetota bacterium]
MNRPRPLVALLLSAATVAALAVPAGASPRATWTHQTLPCATGHKSAKLTQKWQGIDVVKGWVDNPCSGQWLFVMWCPSSSGCSAVDVAPKHHGQGAGQTSFDALELRAAKTCSFGDVGVSQVGAKYC